MQETFIATEDGLKLYCRIVGEGDQTVIIPQATYHADRFDTLARGRRVVLYDPRGRGRSEAVDRSRVSLEYQLRDLEAVREGIGSAAAALVGWSSLGMELFVYTVKYPERVTHLVQLAPLPPRRTPYMEQMIADRERRTDSEAVAALEERQQAGEFDDDPARLCREINYLSWGATFADPVMALEVPDVCVHENEWPVNLAPYLEALLASYGDYDWRPELRRVTIPRLVIHGAEDNIPLQGAKEWAAGQPHARLLVLQGAGHWPHYENRSAVLESVDMFLSGNWPPGALLVA
ncbi:MAG: alpha/beta hydrolase [Gemmatimonadota bacterium]|nr:MAG: alpha/beta hydrolase [Gemmatimonadota bacterium]